jgi:hypothetical protein
VSNYKDYLLNPNAENASIPMEAFSFLGVACGRAVRSNLFVYRVISTTGRNLKQKGFPLPSLTRAASRR